MIEDAHRRQENRPRQSGRYAETMDHVDADGITRTVFYADRTGQWLAIRPEVTVEVVR